jgi:outer membrane lipoprotein-sorting protein
MTARKMKGKGQLSFDMAFAIIMVLAISSALLSYSTTSQQSVERGRRLAALNMAGDYVTGSLNSFYSSLIPGGNATYVLKLPDKFLFNEPDPDKDDYEIAYTVGFVISGTKTRVTLTDTDASHNAAISKELGFRINCMSPLPSNVPKGSEINFNHCTISGNQLSCQSCN